MSRRTELSHQFVETIPDLLSDGVIYVSIEYATAVHLCCCGCRSEVVTPLSPIDWSLIFDGQSIGLTPSIGSWSLPCQSHYWVNHGHVRWSRQWTEEEIARGRRSDRIAKDRFYREGIHRAEPPALEQGRENTQRRPILGWLHRWSRKSGR